MIKKNCAEVDITIIPPTTVVQQHKELYIGFTIESDIDKETGWLTVVHMHEVQHIIYPMILINGLWFHEYSPFTTQKASISQTKNASLNNLWHG